jgi:hypothetical protein
MASAPVVIEMAAPDAARPEAQALLAACTEGLRDRGPCSLGGARGAARAVVVVSWEGTAHIAVKIEVGVRRDSHIDWLARHVAFDPSDTETERWRSVGLVIATLVGESEPRPEPKREEPPSTASRAPTPERATEPAALSDRAAPHGAVPAPVAPWFVDGAVVAARGAGDAFGAWGGLARVGYRLGAAPLFVTASVRYESQPRATDAVSIGWLWGGIGVEAQTSLVPSTLLVHARAEATLAWIRASAADATPQSGTLLGAREGVALTWWWTGWVGPTIGADLVELTRSAVVRVSTDGTTYVPVTTAQWIGWSTTVGLRFQSPP